MARVELAPGAVEESLAGSSIGTDTRSSLRAIASMLLGLMLRSEPDDVDFLTWSSTNWFCPR